MALIPSKVWGYDPADEPKHDPKPCEAPRDVKPAQNPMFPQVKEARCACGAPATQMFGFCFSCSNYG